MGVENKPDKGDKGGSCNITACQKPGAHYLNKGNEKYYCAACAKEINWPGGWADTRRLFGTHLLCEIPADDVIAITNPYDVSYYDLEPSRLFYEKPKAPVAQ
jgi:hypothetical protein